MAKIANLANLAVFGHLTLRQESDNIMFGHLGEISNFCEIASVEVSGFRGDCY
jgi:hypothetical protein